MHGAQSVQIRFDQGPERFPNDSPESREILILQGWNRVMSPQDDVNRKTLLARRQKARQQNFGLDDMFPKTNPKKCFG